jgi:16S rRNA (cytosine1402-N4)-methyltransferase
MDIAEDSRAYHIPVLVHEVVDALITDPGGVYVDATLGGGGHTEAILKKLSPSGSVVGLDIDEAALVYARRRFAHEGRRIQFCRENFCNLDRVLQELNIQRVGGIIADLGISSHQIDEPRRGFSFQSNDRLDMRMDSRRSTNGWNVINEYDEKQLADVFQHYGEERRSHQIARTIVHKRTKESIDTTGQLAAIVTGIVGERFAKKTLARIFQAVRIEVNGELNNLDIFLRHVPEMLVPAGRIGVISYHSLEDRMVKRYFREEAATVIPSGHKLIPDTPRTPQLKIITKDPVTPGENECLINPRARSAKLRVAERT